jgi:hypothetical protein
MALCSIEHLAGDDVAEYVHIAVVEEPWQVIIGNNLLGGIYRTTDSGYRLSV